MPLKNFEEKFDYLAYHELWKTKNIEDKVDEIAEWVARLIGEVSHLKQLLRDQKENQ